MTVALALTDFIPVILFALSGVLLMRDLYNKLSKGAFALMAAGVIMVLVAGIYKASWKLVYALGVADLYLLNDAFLPIQAAGFLILGIGLAAGTFFPQGKGKAFAVAPVAAVPVQERGAMIFIVFIILGYFGFCGSMVRVSVRMKKWGAMVLYILSFFLLLGMGYLGSREFGNNATMNWVEEGINICAQICILLATWILHKSGLAARESL